MIPYQITPEEFAKYHDPAPDYVFAVRTLENYKKIGTIDVPDYIQDESLRFVCTAKLLSVSPYKSDEEIVERMKEILRKKKYISFEFHAIAPVHMMPQFKFPPKIDVVMLHVKDITVIENNLDELIEKQKSWEIEQDKEREKAAKAILIEREAIINAT